jgi:putative DNA primase/helicase
LDLSAVGAHLAGLLPEFFNGAGYVVQFSSTHQHIGNEGVLKAHLWFWLSGAITSAQAKSWLLPWRKQTKAGSRPG